MIWYEKRYKDVLKTTDELPLKVLSSGEWNTADGPDFLNGSIKLGTRAINGDIEIHTHESDWFAHQHNKDPKYKNVVLHVFFIKNLGKKHLRSYTGKKIYQICLSDYIKKIPKSLDFERYPQFSKVFLGTCGKLRADERSLKILINSAGDHRLFSRSAEFDGQKNLEQFLYEKIVESLGYNENITQMRKLAQILNLRKLREVFNKRKYSIRKLQSLVFGASGLLPKNMEHFDDATRNFVKELKLYWENDFREFHPLAMNKEEWNFKNVRPLNFPYRRLSLLAHLLKRIISVKLDKLVERYKQGFQKLFEIKDDDYFKYHITFASKEIPQTPLVGKEWLEIISVNVILPFLLYISKRKKDKKLFSHIFKNYLSIPLTLPNKIGKLMVYRLFSKRGTKIMSKMNERFQQGLLQIFYDFCDFIPDCKNCVFPEIIKTFKA